MVDFDVNEPADVADEVDRYTDLASSADHTRYLVDELVVSREDGPAVEWLLDDEVA